MEVKLLEAKDDVEDLIRAHGLAWRAAYGGILPEDVLEQQSIDPSPVDVQRWEEGLRDNHDGVLVAVDDTDTVRGFADFRWGDAETKDFVDDDEAELKAIYIHPDFWGDGFGTALLARGRELLPEDVDTLRLEMLSENDVGREFYTARGFEQTGTSEYEIGDDVYPTVIYMLEI